MKIQPRQENRNPALMTTLHFNNELGIFPSLTREYTMQIKLAEALLRRKELQAKVELLKKIKDSQVYYEVRAQRVKVTDGIDELSINWPKLELNQVTREYDHAARQLRLIDAAIQQTNWTASIETDPMVMEDFKSDK